MPRLGKRKRSIPPQPIGYPELAVCAWEDLWFWNGIISYVSEENTGAPAFTNIGAPAHWQAFRKFLLENARTGGSHYRVEDFFAPPDWPGQRGFLDLFPRAITWWCAQSRRIYRPDLILQSRLQKTPFNRVSFDIFLPPFDSFAIELAQPIVSVEGDQFSFLLVNVIRQDDIISMDIQSFGTGSDGRRYIPIGSDERKQVEHLIKQRSFNLVGTEHDRFVRQNARCSRWNHTIHFARGTDPLVPDANTDSPTKPTASQSTTGIPLAGGHIPYSPAHQSWWSMVSRTIVGLVLHLQNLPPDRLPQRGFSNSSVPGRQVISKSWEVYPVA